jgi:hypothetical protein
MGCGTSRREQVEPPRFRNKVTLAALPNGSNPEEVAVAKYSRSAQKDVKSAMRRRKKGTLKSGKGGKGGTVKSRRQAIAIGLSEARKKGKKVPKRRTSRKKSSK